MPGDLEPIYERIATHLRARLPAEFTHACFDAIFYNGGSDWYISYFTGGEERSYELEVDDKDCELGNSLRQQWIDAGELPWGRIRIQFYPDDCYETELSYDDCDDEGNAIFDEAEADARSEKHEAGVPHPLYPHDAPAAAPAARNEELCQAIYAAREAFAKSLGEVDGDVLAPLINPSFMGGPQWPDLREAWRVIRRGTSTIILSDGLADPFPEVAEPNHGFALEVLVESSDPFAEALQGTWLFDLVYQVSQQAAHHGGFRGLIDRVGVGCLELPASPHFKPFEADSGRVGVLLGAMPAGRPDGFETPGGYVRIITARLLFPSELAYAAAGGATAREELVRRFTSDGTFHTSSFHRKPVV